MDISGHIFDLNRLFLVVFLLAAAVSKSLHFANFHAGLRDDFHVPANAAMALAILIISVELVIGLCLALYPPFYQGAFIVAFAMMLLFTCVIAWALINHRIIQCNCFGGKAETVTHFDLGRNLITVGASMYGYYWISALVDGPVRTSSDDIAEYALKGMIAICLAMLTINIRKVILLAAYKQK